MQLTYRGIQYNAAPAATTIDSRMTATYRGLLYTVPRATDVPVMSVQTLMYRGIVIGGDETTDQQVLRPAIA